MRLRVHAERGALSLRTSAHDWPRQQQIQLLQWAKALQQGRWKVKQQDQLVAWIAEQLGEPAQMV